jgi:hypothetical protein
VSANSPQSLKTAADRSALEMPMNANKSSTLCITSKIESATRLTFDLDQGSLSRFGGKPCSRKMPLFLGGMIRPFSKCRRLNGFGTHFYNTLQNSQNQSQPNLLFSVAGPIMHGPSSFSLPNHLFSNSPSHGPQVCRHLLSGDCHRQ